MEQENKKQEMKKSLKREIFEWIMVFVVAGAMAFVVRTFIFEPVRVDGASMMYTLEDGEFMIATKYDYLLARQWQYPSATTSSAAGWSSMSIAWRCRPVQLRMLC